VPILRALESKLSLAGLDLSASGEKCGEGALALPLERLWRGLLCDISPGRSGWKNGV